MFGILGNGDSLCRREGVGWTMSKRKRLGSVLSTILIKGCMYGRRATFVFVLSFSCFEWPQMCLEAVNQ